MGYHSNYAGLACCALVFLSVIAIIAGLVAVAHWLPGHIISVKEIIIDDQHYKLFRTFLGVTKYEAEKICLDHDMYLFQPRDVKSNRKVYEKNHENIWINIEKIDGIFKYPNTDSEETDNPDFANWVVGQPDNFLNLSENCVIMDQEFNQDRWVDVHCIRTKAQVICQDQEIYKISQIESLLLEGNEYIFVMTKTATFDEATEICNQINMSKIFEPRTEEEFDTFVDYAKSLGFAEYWLNFKKGEMMGTPYHPNSNHFKLEYRSDSTEVNWSFHDQSDQFDDCLMTIINQVTFKTEWKDVPCNFAGGQIICQK